MAYAIMHFWPGGTAEQYDISVRALHPSDGSLPPGQTFHSAGAVEGGYHIYAVHETKDSWENFRDTVLYPYAAQNHEGGFTGVPVETDIEVHHLAP